MANQVEKLNTIAIADIEKVITLTDANIEKINTLEFAGAVPVEVSLTANAVDSGSATAYTFSSQALGAAADDRIIVVGGFSTNAVQTVSSVTIGGVSAVHVASATDSGGEQCALWQAAVPSGTTGDVVWTWGGAEVGMGIGVWRIVNAVPSAYDFSGVTGASALSSTLDIPANGVAIAYSGAASVNRTATWSGLTEVFDANGIEDGSTSGNHTGASLAFETVQSDLAIAMTLSGAPIRNPVSTMASWGPLGGAETEVAVDRTAGTAIGNMSEVGNLAASFDGTLYKAAAACSRATDATNPRDGYIGKDWGSGNTKKISKFAVYCPTDATFAGTAPTTTVTLKLQGSTDNFSSSVVELSSDTVSNNAYSTAFAVPQADITTSTAYRYHRVLISHTANDRIYNSQCQFWELT